MQSFKQISEDYDTAIKNLKKVKRGSKVSFNHAKTGKKITGTYQGLKRMMGRSYAHVEHPKGSNHPNMIPVHHIHQAGVKKESVDEVSSDKLGAYMRKSAADAGKPGASVRRQDKRIGGQSMADKKIRKKMGYSSTAKVAAGQNK